MPKRALGHRTIGRIFDTYPITTYLVGIYLKPIKWKKLPKHYQRETLQMCLNFKLRL